MRPNSFIDPTEGTRIERLLAARKERDELRRQAQEARRRFNTIEGQLATAEHSYRVLRHETLSISKEALLEQFPEEVSGS